MASILPAIWLSILPSCAPCPEPVKVMVLVILGTDQNKNVTDKLRDIAPELKKKDDRLTGFALHKTIDQPMRLGETVQLELIGKNRVTITLAERTDETGRIILTIKLPKLDEFQYACTCGKFFPVLTNYYTAEKQRLIIAVMAKPCKKK